MSARKRDVLVKHVREGIKEATVLLSDIDATKRIAKETAAPVLTRSLTQSFEDSSTSTYVFSASELVVVATLQTAIRTVSMLFAGLFVLGMINLVRRLPEDSFGDLKVILGDAFDMGLYALFFWKAQGALERTVTSNSKHIAHLMTGMAYLHNMFNKMTYFLLSLIGKQFTAAFGPEVAWFSSAAYSAALPLVTAVSNQLSSLDSAAKADSTQDAAAMELLKRQLMRFLETVPGKMLALTLQGVFLASIGFYFIWKDGYNIVQDSEKKAAAKNPKQD